MLPRRHILDVWELIKDTEDLKSMATITLAIDAIKYMHNEPKKDHLVEALELNEFICFMFPAKRPKNRSLLYHVVSDLVGLLMYGVPNTRKYTINNIETINYSEKNMEIYPVIEVWNMLKTKVKRRKNDTDDIIDGFIRKIRVEMDVLERFPLWKRSLRSRKTGSRSGFLPLQAIMTKIKKQCGAPTINGGRPGYVIQARTRSLGPWSTVLRRRPSTNMTPLSTKMKYFLLSSQTVRPIGPKMSNFPAGIRKA